MPTIRELVVELNLKGDAEKRATAFGLTLTDVKAGLDLAVGAVRTLARGLAELTTELAKQGDEIAKNAKNLGIGVQALQELDFAAKLSGQSANEVRTAIQRMAKGLNDAKRTGTGPFADSLKQVSLRIEDFDALKPDEAFELLADSIAMLEDPLEKAALAQDFFGRGGKTLLPLLNEGADGIQRMRAEFQELGGGFTDDGAAGAEEFQDSLLRMEVVINSVKIAIGEELFPVIIEIVDEIRAWAVENREAIREELVTFIRDLIVGFKSMRATVEQLLPFARDLVFFFVDAAVESANLLREIKQLDERLTEDFGPAWDAVKSTIEAILFPLGAVADAFGFIIQKIDELLTRLETAGGALGDFGKIARGVLFFGLGGGDGEEPTTTRRGAPGFAGGPKPKREPVVALNRANSEQLRAVIGNANNSGASRTQAGLLLPSAILREQAAITQAKVIAGEASLIQTEAADRAAAARKRAADRRRSAAAAGRRGGGGKTRRVSDEELLKLISKAGATGESLDSLIGGRKLEGTTPPVIQVTVTNFNVEQEVSAPVTVTGVPGEQVEELARRVEEQQRDALQDEFRKALEELDPLVSR